MPKGPRTLVDGLAEEVLSDMAASFFGARKEVEELTERAQAMAGQLHDEARRVLALGAVFLGLLAGEAPRALQLLGVEPEPFLAQVPPMPLAEALERSVAPWAWTRRGAYAGRVLAAYGAFREALEAYLHGTHVLDAHGRKVQTPNLLRLAALVETANERIAAVNQRPSQVLRMAHSMDVTEVERERCLGGTLDDMSAATDRDMAYAPLDLRAYGLPVLPDLPDAAAARKALGPLLGTIYDAHRAALAGS